MSDPALDALAREADRRIYAQPTPPVATIYGRAQRRVTPGRRRQLVLPAGAVAAVILTILTAQQLVSIDRRTTQITIPEPPALGVLTPPTTVGARMGALPGHLTGEPVAQADVLAVSPPDAQGRIVRTYGQLQPRPKPDAHGRPLANRCVLTHPDSGPAGTPVGQCQPAALLEPEPRDEVSARVGGLPEATFITGKAPPGTAAVRLEAPGLDPLTVGTAVAGPQWADAVYFTAWWPRSATTVTAYGADRRQIGQTLLPDPTPRRSGPDDPELGVLSVSTDESRLLMHPGATPPEGLLTVDVLARLELAPHVARYTVGILRDGQRCTFTIVQDHSGLGDGQHGGGGGCGSASNSAPAIAVSRAYSAASGDQPARYSIEGSAPAGTDEVVLSSPGRADQRVQAYSGGSRWQDRAFFAADLPSGAPTSVRAVTKDGRTLATFADKGMNLRTFEPAYLEAYARCLEADGITVTRHPQGGGSGPAYEYDLNSLPGDEVERLEARCSSAAGAAS